MDFFESRGEEDEGKRDDGRVLIRRRYVWYLLYAGGEEKEYICVFGELLCRACEW